MKKLLFIPMLFACFIGMGQAAVSKSKSGEGATHTIGEKYGGGIVFNVSPDGLHGLIAETQDQGYRNCFDAYNLVSDPRTHSAAGKLFKDWRIPTKDEMNLLYQKRKIVGGFSNGIYLTMTQNASYDSIWCNNFVNGYQKLFKDLNDFYFRSIRDF
jgi:hypothetical protein